MQVVVIGLSLSSSWGNGHATTYRALLKAFVARGHAVTFLERDVPWYSGPHRDLADPDWCRLIFYKDANELQAHRDLIATTDSVMVGSYVPDGVAVGSLVQDWARGVRAFYDIDTPVTLAKLARGEAEYISPELIRGFDLYLSFTGGPTLDLIERRYGSPAARALYCSVDPSAYLPLDRPKRWDLSYLGRTAPTGSPCWSGC
jgi:spore maturation protein CgeB